MGGTGRAVGGSVGRGVKVGSVVAVEVGATSIVIWTFLGASGVQVGGVLADEPEQPTKKAQAIASRARCFMDNHLTIVSSRFQHSILSRRVNKQSYLVLHFSPKWG